MFFFSFFFFRFVDWRLAIKSCKFRQSANSMQQFHKTFKSQAKFVLRIDFENIVFRDFIWIRFQNFVTKLSMIAEICWNLVRMCVLIIHSPAFDSINRQFAFVVVVVAVLFRYHLVLNSSCWYNCWKTTKFMN